MRRHLSFGCNGDTLIATLDQGERSTGLFIVTGGTQTRTGPHRMMADLAASIASADFPTFRFDRRGCGDSEGVDPGFRESKPDIAAAALAFRQTVPSMRSIFGLGLCDGATALMLHHQAINSAGLILINPWVVEVEPNYLPPAAIRRHYAKRLFTRSGWRQTLRRGFNPMSAAQGFSRAYIPSNANLAESCAASLQQFDGSLNILLADGDGTAQSFENAFKAPRFSPIRRRTKISSCDTSSHSFARIADQSWLTTAILSILEEADRSASPS